VAGIAPRILVIPLEDLRVAGIRALADLYGDFLEVSGTVVIRRSRRISDFANHPDPMFELDGAQIRHHGADGPGMWEQVEGLSLNRDQIVLLVPVNDADPGANPRFVVSGHEVRVKVICRGVQVTGFVRLPTQETMSAFIHESRGRFLPISQARVMASPVNLPIDGYEGLFDFCLLNRSYVIACVETRPGFPNISQPPAGE
jgi:hypothetical protein